MAAILSQPPSVVEYIFADQATLFKMPDKILWDIGV